jgi:hypothetical protein
LQNREAPVRGPILSVVAQVILVAGIIAAWNRTGSATAWIVGAGISLFLTTPIWLLPLLIYISVVRNEKLSYQPCPQGGLPEMHRAFFDNLSAALTATGFRSFAILRVRSNPTSNFEQFDQLFLSADGKVAAFVAAAKSAKGPLRMLEFRTIFQDGTQERTTNRSVPEPCPQPEEITLTWLPDVTEAAALLQAHLAIVANRVGTRPRPVEITDPVAYLDAEDKREMKYQLTNGLARMDKQRQIRPTFKKARLLARAIKPDAQREKRAADQDRVNRLLAEQPRQRRAS